MRKILGTSAAMLAVLLSHNSGAFACGDKLLVLGRGFTFAQIHRSAAPASILIYMNPSSRVPAADKDLQLQTVLKLAGHRLKSIGDRTELGRALTSGGYDFVVADFVDAGALKDEIEAAPGKPILLPLLYNPSKEQLASAQKQFSCAFKASRNNQILRMIEEAMKSKQKGTDPNCQVR